jgi:hypothetical protein
VSDAGASAWLRSATSSGKNLSSLESNELAGILALKSADLVCFVAPVR